MNKAFLLIGGNLGDRENNLQQARLKVEETAGQIVKCSSIYETAAWGIEDQPSFLNQVLLVATTFAANRLLQILLGIEETLGRKRIMKLGPRVIDIDILLFGNEVINDLDLQIPHPALPGRRFALIPLCELAPDYVHPIYRKSIKQLLDECNDELEVQKYK